MGEEEQWLSRPTQEATLNTGLLAEVLREYRQANGLNQAAMAKLLNLDQSYVSKIETGQRQVRDLETLLRIANRLNIPPSHVGVSQELLQPVAPPATETLVDAADPVETSQSDWRRNRRFLNRHRGELAQLAKQLYSSEFHMGDTPFMARPEWMPERPIRLEDIKLDWSEEPVSIEVTGAEPEASSVLPLRAPGHRFERYTSAIRYLDPPALFENRASYRLLSADLRDDSPRLGFGLGTYFDKLDASEAAAHELASVVRSGPADEVPDWTALPLRGLIGDPFDLAGVRSCPRSRRSRCAASARPAARRSCCTGVIPRRSPPRPASTACIPAGEFQPSSVASWDMKNDFDLWRNMVREYSEELLGEPERDGSQGLPIQYDKWPFYLALEKARSDNRVNAYCLGIGLDTLTLTATLLTVVVIDDEVFDDIFGNTVQINAEGALVTAIESTSVSEGVPFTEDTVKRMLTSEPMASPGACILARSWQLRDQILNRQ